MIPEYELCDPILRNTHNATYGMKMPRVSAETMVNLLVPLPPLSEQKRIVAKVEDLLSLCDKLKLK